MVYDAKNGKKLEGENTLPTDTILDGIIINIVDGKVSEFVSESAKEGWKGDLNNLAINIELEVRVPGDPGEIKKINQMFTYFDEAGRTAYTPNSNLGRFVKKYGKLPEVGDHVKVLTNSDGFGKIKID